MKNNPKHSKSLLIIFVIGIIVALIGITFAVFNLRLLSTNGEETGRAFAIFWSAIAILFANLTLFIINLNIHKKTSK